ncbi:MAG: hypothetical protein L6R41_003594 [Letrouitia leprolyta]|nr:MAG: hypothetical protein L6R41_003594 [Letrouitia leprolyta]
MEAWTSTAQKKRYPLPFKAVYDGNPDVVRVLLRAGVNVNGVSDTQRPIGYTTLHSAAELGDMNIARLLLEANAEVDPQSLNGHTPLHKATLLGHQDSIKPLLKYRADPNARAKNGGTPLDVAIRNQRTEAFHMIFNAGGRPSHYKIVLDNGQKFQLTETSTAPAMLNNQRLKEAGASGNLCGFSEDDGQIEEVKTLCDWSSEVLL